MSNIQNEKWLEAAHEHFDEALAQGNLALCKDIISDTQGAGFLGEARLMNDTLRATPVEKFHIISPLQEKDLC